MKMLSYLLENREIDGTRTVERFRAKFADDPATFMNIDASTRGETETILFNIDAEGPINKDKTAVLRVFAKMFYNHLGFYGENLKVAKLEHFIAKRGKTDDFRRSFAERTGTEWLDSRDAFVFFEDDVVAALVETLGMSETAARNWFDGSEDVDMSITRLVTEIKEYLDRKNKVRLLNFYGDDGDGGDDDIDITQLSGWGIPERPSPSSPSSLGALEGSKHGRSVATGQPAANPTGPAPNPCEASGA